MNVHQKINLRNNVFNNPLLYPYKDINKAAIPYLIGAFEKFFKRFAT